MLQNCQITVLRLTIWPKQKTACLDKQAVEKGRVGQPINNPSIIRGSINIVASAESERLPLAKLDPEVFIRQNIALR